MLLPSRYTSDSPSSDGAGLLIVNADDWGGYPEMTDAALKCFEAGGITSATAMMWMKDAPRAAELALAAGLPTGLHLNLTLPVDNPNTPRRVRERQHALAARFRRLRLRRWVYNPSLRNLVESVIHDQLERFHQLYGRAPTHIDGHEHAHLALNVIFSTGLRAVGAVRCDTPAARWVAQRLRDHWLRQRFRTPDVLIPVEHLFDERGAVRGELLSVADHRVVDVMTHPGWEEDERRLLSTEWLEEVARYRVGSFADLPHLLQPPV